MKVAIGVMKVAIGNVLDYDNEKIYAVYQDVEDFIVAYDAYEGSMNQFNRPYHLSQAPTIYDEGESLPEDCIVFESFDGIHPEQIEMLRIM